MARCDKCSLLATKCDGGYPAAKCIATLMAEIDDLQAENDALHEEVRTLKHNIPITAKDNLFQKQLAEELAKISEPAKPQFYPQGEWNHAIYGFDGNWVIYIDGEATHIDNSVYQILNAYSKAYLRYEKKVNELKRGIGIHENGICPACGVKYERYPIDLCTGRSKGPRGQHWHCPDCGCTGREVYDTSLIEQIDLVDHLGYHIQNRVLEESNDANNCPFCGKRFRADEMYEIGKPNVMAWRCGGTFGIGGCGGTGKLHYERTFTRHANVLTQTGSQLWD